ncbi:MAG: TRAP transporter small permease [Desulfocapsa sp.]|nr:TRAP transporter small permease [Desulfocapsa sp.]
MNEVSLEAGERLHKKLIHFQSRTILYGKIFCVTCLAAIVICTSLSVFFRYVFFFPLNFSDPLSVYLLTWLTFVGTGIAVSTGEHVYVDFFLSRFPDYLKKVMVVITAITVSFFLVLITYYGFIFAWAMRDSSDPMIFGMSLLVPYLSVPVGATYCLLQIWLAAIISLLGTNNNPAQFENNCSSTIDKTSGTN